MDNEKKFEQEVAYVEDDYLFWIASMEHKAQQEQRRGREEIDLNGNSGIIEIDLG
jgi:hypothetical protein